MTRRVRIANYSLQVPGSPKVRRLLGFALIIGGTLGFLPVLGFWMVPLGLIILSVDSVRIRRWRRQAEVRYGPWLKQRYPKFAGLLGLSNNANCGKKPNRDTNSS